MSSRSWVKVRDKESLKEADAAVAQAESPKLGLKEFLDARYIVPEAVMRSHARNWAPRPIPPLSKLCPKLGFSVETWDAAADGMHQWFQKLEEDGGCYSTWINPRLAFTPYWLLEPFKESVHFQLFSSSGLPRADKYMYSLRGQPVMVFLMDMDNLRGKDCPGDPVLARLVNYMLLSNTRFGILSCLEQTWICKSLLAERKLLVSKAIDTPAKALGYTLALFQSENDSENGTAPPACGYNGTEDCNGTENCNGTGMAYYSAAESVVRGFLYSAYQSPEKQPEFHAGALMQIVESVCCKRAGGERATKLVSIVNTSFVFKDLQNARKLRSYSQQGNLVTFKGSYMGRRVVVKVRDLTSPWWHGFRGSLSRMVAEVDTYMALEGSKCVAEFMSWGFTWGGMFTYVMLSDEGKTGQEMFDHPEEAGGWRYESPNAKTAALYNVKAGLHELHKRGILHGDVDVSKVVVKQQEPGGGWMGTLVGFGESRLVNVDDVLGAEAVAREKMKLCELLAEIR